MRTLSARDLYVVESVSIVSPEDVHVLDPTASPVLTLVTCYPFYFVGSAPQRWVVRAVPRDAAPSTKPARPASGASLAKSRKEADSPGKEQ
jgi:sortase (surface protein transpeptidase)